MRKNKHQELAYQLKKILSDINTYINKGISVSEPEPFSTMCKTHFLALKNLSPNFKIFDFYNYFFMVNERELQKFKAKLIITCSDKEEFFSENSWFEEDDNDFIFNDFKYIERSNKMQKQNLLNNLRKNSTAIIEQVIGECYLWKVFAVPYPQDPRDFIRELLEEFSNQPTVMALAKIKSALKHDLDKNLKPLYLKLEYALENAMKKDTVFADENKKDPFAEVFDPHKKKPKAEKKLDDSHQQCYAIDIWTMTDFILYYINKAVENPKDKKYGEIACVLWVLIWTAQESKKDHKITIKNILDLNYLSFCKENQTLCIDGVEICISIGLSKLLIILINKSKGLKKHKLFPNVSMGTLERSLQEASKNIFLPNSTSVSPKAFLTPPHQHFGLRISSYQRKLIIEARKNSPIFQEARNATKKLKNKHFSPYY